MCVSWKLTLLLASYLLQAVHIKLLSSLDRDDLRKLCGDKFPEWISFPTYEQVKWINKALSELWPFFAEVRYILLVGWISSSSSSKPFFFTQLSWSQLYKFCSSIPIFSGNNENSGSSVLLQFLHSDESSRISDSIWKTLRQVSSLETDCDEEITLFSATTIVIKESVEPLLEDYRPPGISSLKFCKLTLGNVAPKIEGFLKDLQVFAVIHVIFQLAEEIPCISAVVVALLCEAVGGSLTAVPGLSDMINDTVNTIVTDKLQWPHRIIIPIGGIPVDTSELELKPQGRLSVTVVIANALKNVEMIGKSDPYVVVYIQPIFKFKTKVADDNLNPVWNQTFELIVEDKETQALILEKHQKNMNLRLLPSLDMLKVKDKEDRGLLLLSKEEQLAALEEEKWLIEERRKLKESGVIGSTLDEIEGAASLVGSGVGLVGAGLGAGAGRMGSGLSAPRLHVPIVMDDSCILYLLPVNARIIAQP
ncbi:synaptotagmin-5-like protein isoform X1 [Cinnamomum micranthum f. kanehirae]|uniref:Synaptotagmin-5-like protein isoform X1 n=1 Tax=Cinnamomum micranthum f. kanehirae TaxID=337451 RepID=A0A443NTD8_9MAGN|nr:synaptotagmin-5-like protein isoform X1 [Cinnamomum micranthum f. kanehirae]